MKKPVLVILFLFVAHLAFPQLNSIEFQKELPAVNVILPIVFHPKFIFSDLNLLPQLSVPISKKRVILLASLPLEDFFITSKYGYRSDPFYKKKTFHRGIDLKTKHSTVFAMLHGKVVSVGNDPLLGNYVKIQHGKYESIYGHLSETWVTSGENVLPGSLLGISGSTGNSTGDHLHLTIKKGKKYINPTLFIQMISKLSTKEELITYLSKP